MPAGPARALDQPGVPISTGLVLVQDENASVAQAPSAAAMASQAGTKSAAIWLAAEW